MPEPDSSSIVQLILIFLCILVSCLFSATETAFTTVNKIRLRSLSESGSYRAQKVLQLLEKHDKLLTTILVGNNFVNISASALSTAYAIHAFGDQAVGIATGIITFMILVFGEVTPKIFAVRYSETICFIAAGPIYVLQIILTPVVFLLNKISAFFLFITGGNKMAPEMTITEAELMTMVNMGHEQGVLENEERHMIRNVFEFGDGMVREVMTPRINVALADITWSYREVLEVFKEHQFTRMPVYKESADEIIGTINLKDLLLQEVEGIPFCIQDILRPAHFVYEFNNISKVFAQMRKERVGISIVLDEYGIMAGVVTMEDFIEEIVGEITDEYDEIEEELIHKIGDEYLVDGSLSIDAFNDVVGTDFESDEFESIGGYLLGIASELPSEGTGIYHEDLLFTIEKIDSNRIETIRVKWEQEQPAAQDLFLEEKE